MTPSEDVDQAWHLHLASTRDYWQTICRDVLREPLDRDARRGELAVGRLRWVVSEEHHKDRRLSGVIGPDG